MRSPVGGDPTFERSYSQIGNGFQTQYRSDPPNNMYNVSIICLLRRISGMTSRYKSGSNTKPPFESVRKKETFDGTDTSSNAAIATRCLTDPTKSAKQKSIHTNTQRYFLRIMKLGGHSVSVRSAQHRIAVDCRRPLPVQNQLDNPNAEAPQTSSCFRIRDRIRRVVADSLNNLIYLFLSKNLTRLMMYTIKTTVIKGERVCLAIGKKEILTL